MEGNGKLACSYGGGLHHHHHDTVLLKRLSGVEPRKFGVGLVAGLLLVTFAYFSTVKFAAIHIVMSRQPIKPQEACKHLCSSNPALPCYLHLPLVFALLTAFPCLRMHAVSSGPDKNANGIGSPVNAGDSSKQTPGLASSPEENKDETSTRDVDASVVVVAPTAQPNPAMEVIGKDELVEKYDEDEASGVGVLPPLSADPADSTQDSGVLEDQELEAQNAVAAAAANPPNKESNSISSNENGSSSPSVIPSAPAEIPLPPPQQIAASDSDSEAKAPPVVQSIPPIIPEVKQADREEPQQREWKPLCDVTSNRRIDWCELAGDVRVLGADGSVTLVAPPGADNDRAFHEESWSIKPYPRKADPNAMRNVRALTVRSVSGGEGAPACTDRHGDVPALVFSDRGYTGNYFHAFTDVVLPLFLTAQQYSGEVVLLVTDFQMWWWGKFLPVFRSLSKYEPVDLDKDPRVHCFRRVQVGLTSHDDFGIDPRRAPNGSSMVDFTRFMRAAYGLPRDAVFASPPPSGRRRRPRLLVIARARTRRFLNTEEIVRGARKVGFEVVVSEGGHEVAPFAELVNACDAVVGVHGAGLTNMVFLPAGGVVIQVIPLGPLEFVASYFRRPARDMGLRYLEYRIAPEESTLLEQYPRDHPVLTDPGSIKAKDWVSFMGVYLFKQDVRLDMKRFRPVLKKALARLRAKPN
ncbi:hypothetical protein U9M48_020595 [Paspalum notatum var. saurae]|uniref:Glycosyltransferase 61 catalytic domain-containing protein n=1 Tax=Paspalum notatum var. saurae TaxID=547442 RepID=A0AAQ3TGH4_PASNO